MSTAPPIEQNRLEQAKSFLGRLQTFVAKHQNLRARIDLALLRAFYQRLAPVRARHEAYEIALAPGYNIFEVLAIRHYEARVHTPFLVNLLDPKGSHRQGDLFYRTFIRDVLREEQPFVNCTDLEVTGEYDTGTLGRIDILIHHRSPSQPHCIIIENKIYAIDQPDQLARYDQFARQEWRFDENNYRLLYLTLWKTDRPSEHTMHGTMVDELFSKKILRMISYQHDILPWLQNIYSSQTLLPPVLRETLKQYLLTLKHLLQ